MYYIVLEIYIGGRFLEDCLYFYSQKIIPVVAKESLFPITLCKEHQKYRTFNTAALNATAKPNKKNVKYDSFLKQKTYINNKISS